MPTNEERREIAARLRSVTNEEYSMVFLDEILAGCIGGILRDSDYDIIDERVVNRLADLIEPEPERTCERLARGDSRDLYTYWVCSECNGSMPNPSNYCPNCGARLEQR